MGMYQKALTKSRGAQMRRIALGTVLTIACVLLRDEIGSFAPLLIAAFGALACWGFVGLMLLVKWQKPMKAFGVDAAAMAQFEEEYAEWKLQSATGTAQRSRVSVVYTEMTRSFLFCRKPSVTCLLPLREVVWFHKRVVQNAGNSNTVSIYFRDGSVADVFCGEESMLSQVDVSKRWTDALKECCPKAVAGYTHQRKAMWFNEREAFLENVRKGVLDFGE